MKKVVVGIISQIMSGNIKFLHTIGTIIVAILWTWLLNFICKSGYTTVSWILVFLPIILFILVFLFLINLVKGMSQEDKKELTKSLSKNM